MKYTSQGVCLNCATRLGKDIGESIKDLEEIVRQFEAANDGDEKKGHCKKIMEICRYLTNEYASKGIPTTIPDPQKIFKKYQKKLTRLEPHGSSKNVGDVYPKYFKNNTDVIDDMIWSTATDKKTCDICQKRDGKTMREIEDLKDGCILKIPCHEKCRCAWIPKVKSLEELLDPIIEKIKAMPGKIDHRAKLKPFKDGKIVHIESFQDE